MRLSILLLIFCLLKFSYSQTFEFEYSTQDDDRLWDVFETEDGSVFCVGHVAEPQSYKYKGLILKVNSEGNLIEQKIISIPNRTYEIFGVLQDTLGSLILYGKSCDTTSKQHKTKLEILSIDYQLNILDSVSYLIDSLKRMGGLRGGLGINGDIVLASGLMSETPPYSYGIILRLNRSLDSIRFCQLPSDGFEQIRQLNDSTYWVTQSYGSYFCTLDTLFNYQNCEKVPNKLTQRYGLKWDTDTSFFMSGKWNGGPDDIGILRQFHPLKDTDHLFNTWEKVGSYDYPAPNGGLDFINKDSVYVGIISPFYPWLNYPSNYVLLQTDSLLNIRWEKFYGDGEYYYELMRVFATNDGGCILAGTKYDFNTGVQERDIYLVKVDGDGLMVGYEESPIQIHEAIVYPNPGTTEIKVRIAAQYPESLFQLFDLNGKQVASEKMFGKFGSINTGFLKSGTYIYRISSKDGLFESGKWVRK